MKPTTNLFQKTSSQKKKFSEEVFNSIKSKNYRHELEPLLGAVVNIACSDYKVYSSTVDGKSVNKILLLDAEVIKAPKNRNIRLPVKIPHIWTIVDEDWVNRNKIHPYRGFTKDFVYLSCDYLLFRGFVYEYISNEKKNIGLQTLSIRPKMSK